MYELLVIAISLVFTTSDYVYIPKSGVTYRHYIGGKVCIVRIDEIGGFNVIDDTDNRGTKGRDLFVKSGPPFLLDSIKQGDRVYEYRSGVLVPMVMDLKLGLIPEVGGGIISFKDYKYSVNARRIYNLPGIFVLKATKK